MAKIKLKKGDKIMIVSPSGVIKPEYVWGAVKFLHDSGFEPVVGDSALASCGRFAGTPDERIADMQRAIDDASVKAVLCSRGGYGAVQIVDKLDFSSLKTNPKYLIGFSDITVFHSALTNMKIPSVHASMAKYMTEYPQEEPQQKLLGILGGKKMKYEVPPHPLNRQGVAKGVLTGGNLSVLYGLRGTPYDIRPKGKILFIEDLSEAPYHVDRMMNNLRLGGILKQISGLVVGQFTDMTPDDRMKNVYEIIADAVADYDYPVCFDFPAGHVPQNYPLLMGARCKLAVTEKSVVLKN